MTLEASEKDDLHIEYCDPSPEQRFNEIATILARAVLRLKTSREDSAPLLENSPEMRLHDG